jgi:hypothetical protein
MSNEPFYAPNRKVPPPQPRIGEPLWTVEKDSRRLACELRDDGEAGVEVQVSRDGELLSTAGAGRRARWHSRKPTSRRLSTSATAACSSRQRRSDVRRSPRHHSVHGS